MAATRASEHAEQVALFGWAVFASVRWPELALLHAIPNGGHRNKITAARLKGEGVRRGVPDICLPVARGGFHGLYVEMKAQGGRPSDKQKAWIAALRAQGYRAEVCVGWHAARQVIEDYIAGNATCRECTAGDPRRLTSETLLTPSQAVACRRPRCAASIASPNECPGTQHETSAEAGRRDAKPTAPAQGA